MLGNDFTQHASKFEHKYYNRLGSSDGSHHEKADDIQGEADITQLAGFNFVKDYIVNSKTNQNDHEHSQPIAPKALSEELSTFVKRGKTLYHAMTGIHELEAMSDFFSK